MLIHSQSIQISLQKYEFSDPVLDLLNSTKLLLSTPDKWVQHTLMQVTPKFFGLCSHKAYCLYYALEISYSNSKMPYSVFDDAYTLLVKLLPYSNYTEDYATYYPKGYDITKFNDDPKTTHASVITLLDVAISHIKKNLSLSSSKMSMC